MVGNCSLFSGKLIEQGDLPEAGLLSEKMVARFPLVTSVWPTLAHLHASQKNLPAERAAWEEALALNPYWSWASRRLADTLIRSNQFTEARRILDLARIRDPLGVEILYDLATLDWQLGERQSAVDRLENAIRLSPGYDFAWERLQSWTTEMSRPEATEKLARWLTETRPGEARSWFFLGQFAREIGERIRASQQALSMNPGFETCRDQLALLFLENNQVAIALEACQFAQPGVPRSNLLRGREAWIHAQTGNVEEAIRLMESVVRDFPDYYWGWSQLRDWRTYRGERNKAIEAAEKLVWLAPRNCIALGCLAESHLEAGNTEEATLHLEKAVHLDPSYSWGMNTLFGLQVKKKDWPSAEATLQLARDQHIPWLPIQLETRLLIARKRKKEALKLFGELLKAPESETHLIAKTLASFDLRKWRRAATNRLSRAINLSETNPAVGEIWYHRLSMFPIFRAMKRVDQKSPCAPSVWKACLESVGEKKTLSNAPIYSSITRFLAGWQRSELWKRLLCLGQLPALWSAHLVDGRLAGAPKYRTLDALESGVCATC
jgi:cellulose synthase operon protein C